MGRTAAGVACLVLLGGLAAGCSGSGDEIDEWMDAESARVGGDLGSVIGPVSPSEPSGGPGGDGVLPYDTSEGAVTGVELSCFGNETLTFYLETGFDIDGPSRGDGVEVDVTCADGPHTEAVDTRGTVNLGVGISGAEHEGAYSVVFLGD